MCIFCNPQVLPASLSETYHIFGTTADNSTSQPALISVFPPELRNLIYENAIFRSGRLKDTDPVEVPHKLVVEDGKIQKLDAVQFLTRDVVNNFGKSTLFGSEIMTVKELSTEFRTFSTRRILFNIPSPGALFLFAEAFRAQTDDSNENWLPVLHVECDLLAALKDKDETFAEWHVCDHVHGALVDARAHVKLWLEALAALPPSAIIYLTFSCL